MLDTPAHTEVGVPNVTEGAGITVIVAVPAVKPVERTQPLLSVTLTNGKVLVDAIVAGEDANAVPLVGVTETLLPFE